MKYFINQVDGNCNSSWLFIEIYVISVYCFIFVDELDILNIHYLLEHANELNYACIKISFMNLIINNSIEIDTKDNSVYWHVPKS